jgi:holo-[acyl-carrier protein] synthase
VPDVGVGIDLVAVPSFQARFEGREDVLAAMFTEQELGYCQARRRRWAHLAARFAAKEATWKALGSGLSGNMVWRDVEVRRDVAGAPALVFTGATAGAVARARFGRAAVSLSHAADQAIAVVLLLPE